MEILEELPMLVPEWPCLKCGAHQASAYNVDDKWRVIDCNNCEHVQNRTHAENGKCWCGPELVYRDEITGTEVWSHNQSHLN